MPMKKPQYLLFLLLWLAACGHAPATAEPYIILSPTTGAVAIIPNQPIFNFRYIRLIPYHQAHFDGQWHFTQQYRYLYTLHTLDLLPEAPFITPWLGDQGLTESGLAGVAWADEMGQTRYYILRKNYHTEAFYLAPFENTPPPPHHPQITLVQPTPAFTLVAAWVPDPLGADQFLQPFARYTRLENPNAPDSQIIFNATIDLQNFQFFNLGQVCDPWVGEDFHPFYVGDILDTQDTLPVGVPLVVPWHPGGTMPTFGIHFLDEMGQPRYFSLNTNEGSGYPPLFIHEFTSRGYCPHCYLQENATTIPINHQLDITIAHTTPALGEVAFIPSATVYNFRYLRICGAEIQFVVKEELFAVDTLSPHNPLRVNWFAAGSGAYGGFAFDDQYGTTWHIGFNYCAIGETAFRWRVF